ncbi:Ldh family oxidoreductase [Roseixanthobacter liquoris]|uniref:Ldh family oxidoreductase n=1 Tax=Roseixanthobacter liquoris TaxID=3119921 RepID=UPI003729B971
MPSLSEIEHIGLTALGRAGVPADHAEQQLSLLVEAELRGYPSHGLLRLSRILERIANGVVDPRAKGQGRWRGAALLEVDGMQGLGPVVALNGLDAISARAKETGIAMAAIRRCDHLGMLAWYAEKIARKGQVLLALTISEALVHPWGGRKAMLGTNPIAIGVPATPHPFVFDMATSIVAMGKIHDHAARGAPIPLGWALDAQGDPTTDATAAKSGAIAPFGGAKGYGLGLAFEVLVASLAACALGPDVRGTLDSTHPCNKGDVFIIMEPAAHMAGLVSQFLDDLRTSVPADADHPVRIPGDRAGETRKARMGRDIPVAPSVWAHMRALAGEGPDPAPRAGTA